MYVWGGGEGEGQHGLAAWRRGGVEAKKTRRGQAANAVENTEKDDERASQTVRSKLPLALKQVGRPLSKPPSQLRLRPVEVLAPRVFARRLCR